MTPVKLFSLPLIRPPSFLDTPSPNPSPPYPQTNDQTNNPQTKPNWTTGRGRCLPHRRRHRHHLWPGAGLQVHHHPLLRHRHLHLHRQHAGRHAGDRLRRAGHAVHAVHRAGHRRVSVSARGWRLAWLEGGRAWRGRGGRVCLLCGFAKQLYLNLALGSSKQLYLNLAPGHQLLLMNPEMGYAHLH